MFITYKLIKHVFFSFCTFILCFTLFSVYNMVFNDLSVQESMDMVGDMVREWQIEERVVDWVQGFIEKAKQAWS